MKSRLEASISLLYSGTCRRIIRNAVSSRSIVSSAGSRHCRQPSGFQSQKFESSNGTLQSNIEDDGFSELGPEKSECSPKPIKLATEKIDPFLKSDRFRREFAAKSLSSNTKPKIKDIVATIGIASPTSNIISTKDTKLDDGPTHASSNDSKSLADKENPHPVTIKNIPSKVSLSELIEGVSVFGKVSGASFVTASNGLKHSNIKFENVDSSRSAISAGQVTVGNHVFPVHQPDPAEVVAVRIKNINKVTTDYVIHARCKSAGELVGLSRTSKDAVDVYFNASNQQNVSSILRKLNKTTVDQSQWSANLHTSESTSSEISPDEKTRGQLGGQILSRLLELRRRMDLKKVHFQDLLHLQASIMYIKEVNDEADLSCSK